MSYNEQLAKRVREALADLPNVTEKAMFGGLAFMVNDKMCINVSKDRLMCRIDPALHEDAVSRNGVTAVQMRGRDYVGFVYVDPEGVRNKKDFEYWIDLSLAYNKISKRSKKK